MIRSRLLLPVNLHHHSFYDSSPKNSFPFFILPPSLLMLLTRMFFFHRALRRIEELSLEDDFSETGKKGKHFLYVGKLSKAYKIALCESIKKIFSGKSS